MILTLRNNRDILKLHGDDTHNKKLCAKTTRGVIPITKNIIVVDESGNEYTSTYAKRAKGLVKNGRARWLDGNTICLVCPPDILDLEDNNMENRAENTTINEVSENNHSENVSTKTNPMNFSAADILDRIDKIIEQGNQMLEATLQICNLPVNDSPYGGQDGAKRATAIGNIYTARENTNQQLIQLLNRMYDDVRTNAGFSFVSPAQQENRTADALMKLSKINDTEMSPRQPMSFVKNSLM